MAQTELDIMPSMVLTSVEPETYRHCVCKGDDG